MCWHKYKDCYIDILIFVLIQTFCFKPIKKQHEKSFTFNYNFKERWKPGKMGNLWVIELKFIGSSGFCLLHQIGNLVMGVKKDSSPFSALQPLSHSSVTTVIILPSSCLLQWDWAPQGQARCLECLAYDKLSNSHV